MALKDLARLRDPTAWRPVVDQAGPEMMRIAARLAGQTGLAEDAVQEAMLQIRDGADTFAPVGDDADADAWRWIMRVAANAALQVLRRQNRALARDQRAGNAQDRAAINRPEDTMIRDDTATIVRRELAELPEPTRAAIVLHVMEGFGYEQVAATLRVPIGTAKARVSRGLAALRARLAHAGLGCSLAAVAGHLQDLPAAVTAMPAAGQSHLVELLHHPGRSHVPGLASTGHAVLWAASGVLAVGVAAGSWLALLPPPVPTPAGVAMPAPEWVPGTVLHVAADGSDAMTGTAAQPFATLERARDALRQLRKQGNGGLPGGAMVLIHEGLYLRQGGFVLAAEDSGTRDAPVVWSAEPGAMPRLVGATSLPKKGFRRIANTPEADRFRKDKGWWIWSCDLGALPTSVPGPMMEWGSHGDRVTACQSELFIDGQRMILSRWPNQDEILREAFDPARTREWQADPDIWMRGADRVAWMERTARVALPVDAEKLPDKGFHFFNVREELDVKGEYWIDRQKRRLYVMPDRDDLQDHQEILLSTLTEPVIALRQASWITLRGLAVECTRGDGIVIDGGDHAAVEGCSVRNIGRDGIVVGGGERHAVIDCLIADTGAHGVSLQGGDIATGRHAGHLVADCDITRPGRHLGKARSRAIHLTGVGHTISHNEIHDTITGGLDLNGYHNVYCGNDLYDLSRDTNDSGAIYGGSQPTWGTGGCIFRHNHIHDLQGAVNNFLAGIYADCNRSAGFIVGNVFAHLGSAGRPGIGVMVNGGRMNRIVGNLFIAIDRPVVIGRGTDKPVEHENWMVAPYLKLVPGNPLFLKYPQVQDPGALPRERWNEEMTLPRYNSVVGNAFIACGAVRFDKEVNGLILQDGNLSYATPAAAGITDAGRRDYALRKDARIFLDIPGFQDIPFRQIGRRTGRHDPCLLWGADFDMSGGEAIPTLDGKVLCALSTRGVSALRSEFRGPSGTYDVVVRCKDGRGGRATLAVSLGGRRIAAWTLDRDDDAWSERTIAQIAVKRFDEVRLDCGRSGTDAAAVEWLHFVRKDSP